MNVIFYHITLLPDWGYDPLQPGDPRGLQRGGGGWGGGGGGGGGSTPLFRQRITIDLIV